MNPAEKCRSKLAEFPGLTAAAVLAKFKYVSPLGPRFMQEEVADPPEDHETVINDAS
jgi:hypothetical protein